MSTGLPVSGQVSCTIAMPFNLRELSGSDVLVEPKGVVRVVFAFDLGEAVVVGAVCGSHSAGVVVVEVIDVGAIGHVRPKRFVGLPSPTDPRLGFGWVAPMRAAHP